MRCWRRCGSDDPKPCRQRRRRGGGRRAQPGGVRGATRARGLRLTPQRARGWARRTDPPPSGTPAPRPARGPRLRADALLDGLRPPTRRGAGFCGPRGPTRQGRSPARVGADIAEVDCAAKPLDCDGEDNDCDGMIDEADELEARQLRSVDPDHDGYPAAAPRWGCAGAEGEVAITPTEAAVDCNDTRSVAHAGVSRVSAPVQGALEAPPGALAGAESRGQR